MFLFQAAVFAYMVNAVKYKVKSTWEGYWNRDKVIVQDIRRYYHDEHDLHDDLRDEDITDHVMDLLQTHGTVQVGKDTDWVELRYVLNGNKYRVVTNTLLRLPNASTPGVDDDKYFMATDMETGEDYTERFLKFAGPFKDFHGLKEIPIRWLFPNRDLETHPVNALLVIRSTVYTMKDKLVLHDGAFFPSI